MNAEQKTKKAIEVESLLRLGYDLKKIRQETSWFSPEILSMAREDKKRG